MPSRKHITKATRTRLYSSAEYLDMATGEELGLRIPFDVYLQDPQVATNNAMCGIEKNLVRWEPGISDGPTSARFAVLDYDNETGQLAPLARWKDKEGVECFVDENNKVLDRKNAASRQFDQVNVWALLQRALEFFESGPGLGRPIPYGFEGNRLIVVPHAGYGKNAFYDRASKSLQFYYFDDEQGNRINTCLSTDIVNHEFGHAVLDGVRPYLYESSLVETGAFHEFMGDLSAILLLLRNNTFRKRIAKDTGGNLSESKQLKSIAEQFGTAVTGNEYLRTAQNDLKMSDVLDSDGPHRFSEVLTGAMYDILIAFSNHYIKQKETAANAFWHAIERMQRVAIQPLDLLPPVDVTFRDYAMAVLRAEQLANPTDPFDYCGMMLGIFQKREIISAEDAKAFKEPRYVFHRLRLDVSHSVEDISRSRAAAYRFLNDNRRSLLIPANQDVLVADLYDANKTTREGLRVPRQIILEYIWREDVLLEGGQFGDYDGRMTTMLCGGTLVLDENGNVLSWSRKPGTTGAGQGSQWEAEREEGIKRRDKFLSDLAMRIKKGQVGAVLGSGKGILGTHVPPLVVGERDGLLQFNLSPHMHLAGEDHEHYEGGSQWEVSS